jgi:MFS family permease
MLSYDRMRLNKSGQMSQIHKFYLTEFLKTQRYFIPIMILFLQFHKLSYTEIFLLYAIQSFVEFLLEIPSGVFADLFGKKAALLISRASLIPAYALFALADNFWIFLLAMTFIAQDKAFKSGTHKAYIFDYMEQNPSKTTPSEVFGKNKFWARMGEALASVAGGFIAAKLGFPAVFVFALFPALINLVNALTYEKIEEKHRVTQFNLSVHFRHIGESLIEIKDSKIVRRLIINSAIFVSCMEASEKFFQPYMVEARIPIEWFGIVYMVILVITAFGSRYAYLFETKFRRTEIANFSGWVGIIPFVILGLKFVSIAGIFLFFLILFLKSARRPAMITELNTHISSGKRATILSTDSFFRALFLLAFLPIIGSLSDSFSIYTAILTIGVLLLLNQLFFHIPLSQKDQ